MKRGVVTRRCVCPRVRPSPQSADVSRGAPGDDDGAGRGAGLERVDRRRSRVSFVVEFASAGPSSSARGDGRGGGRGRRPRWFGGGATRSNAGVDARELWGAGGETREARE